MKSDIKKILSLVFAVVIILSMSVTSFAMVQGDIDGEIQKPGMDEALNKAWRVIEADKGKTLEEISDENYANYYHYNPYGHTEPIDPPIRVAKNDSWDEVISMLFDKYGIEENQDNIALTYYNTVTGESHSYNADKYFVTASLFKVPLCMLIAEKVSAGEITMQEPIYGNSFDYLEWRALAHSDNDAARVMEEYLGGFVAFRDKQVKFMGHDPKEDLGDSTYYESYNSAAQMENCLKILYQDPEKFPGVIENLLVDTPYEYFKMWERRYPTAQKWGYVPHVDAFGRHDYVNNCGIIYTDQPIILVVMTDNLSLGYDVIGEYSTLMIDYTNFRTEEYKVIEETAVNEEMENLERRNVSDYLEVSEPVAVEMVESAQTGKEFKMSVLSSIILLLIVSAVVFALVYIFRRNKGGRITPIWAVISIIIVGAALILCVFAANTGAISAKAEGNPQDTVRTFFDALQSGRYDDAYACLSDYSSLGLENEPQTEEGKLLFNAVKKSWSYTMNGEPQINKLTATQSVKLRYLNLAKLNEDVQNNIDDVLNYIVQHREHDEVYGSDNKFKTSVTDEVYLTCLSKALENADSYYKTVDITIDLEYINGKWMIRTNSDLLSYLLGGISD